LSLIDFRTSLAVFMHTPFGSAGRFPDEQDYSRFWRVRARPHKRIRAAEAALFLVRVSQNAG
jgi:hypothetical protein